MAVDDHGLETLKKAAEQVTPGDKSNYYYKTKITNSASDPVFVSTNYEKALDLINKSKWLDLCVFDHFEFSLSLDRQTFTASYFEDGYLVALAEANFTSDFMWDFALFRYIVDDDGSILTEDDGTDLLLE